MKTLKFAILLVIASLFACSPYQKMNDPVRMNYAVYVFDNSQPHGHILCRDYEKFGNTLFLYDAGYFARPLFQRSVADIQINGTINYMIIDLYTPDREREKRYKERKN